MWPVSDAFREAIASSHRVAHKIEVLRGGGVIASLEGIEVSGRVTIERGAAIRRRLDLEIADPEGTLVPTDPATDLLSIYGNEIRPWRGVTFADGSSELVPLGTFRLTSVEVADSETIKLRVSGYDRARSVARAGFEDPYVVAEGTNYAGAIRALIASRLDPLPVGFQLMATPRPSPQLVFGEADDPWAKATEMAASIGAEIFFDPMGDLVLRPEPDASLDPVVTWEYLEGSDATVTETSHAQSDEEAYSVAIVVGETSAGAPPVRAIARDADPLSPTYYLGPYGRVTSFDRSQYVGSPAQGEDMARARIRRKLGTTETVEIAAVAMPAHDASDIARVLRSRSALDGLYSLDRIEMPIGFADTMKLTARLARPASQRGTILIATGLSASRYGFGLYGAGLYDGP